MQEVNVEDVLGHLKAVFEACDQNGDGFVKTQDLLRLGQEHTSEGFEVQLYLLHFAFPDMLLLGINTTVYLGANHSFNGVEVNGCFEKSRILAVPQPRNQKHRNGNQRGSCRWELSSC